MASESERIRQLMDLLEGNTKPMILNEGWLQNLRNKKIKKLGNKERAEMAQRLKGEWLKWLGQTGREGTMDDMYRFMKIRIGFEDHDIDAVTHSALEPEEASGASEPSSTEPNDEDGIPLPKDLNAKLSDFGEVGIKVEPKDNQVEPREIVDNPKKYQLANGDWDRKKISAKLDKMQIGDKLTLGKSTFSRSVGDAPKNESVMEADEDVAEILSDDVVDAIFDASAARINDEYLLNGPRNDQASAAADAARMGLGNRNSGRQATDRGEMPSGRYDTKEMLAILQSDLNVSRDKLKKITDHVKKNTDDGYAGMQRTDVDVLARIGYALLRART